MEWIKLHWKEIVIGILIIFCFNKCTQSCSRQNEINQQAIQMSQLDSINMVMIDSIAKLNTIIKVYEEKVSGLNQALNIQDEANKRLSEAKKNINVNVKK